MKISRRKMFASLGLLPVAMIPTSKVTEQPAKPKTIDYVVKLQLDTTDFENDLQRVSLIHQSKVQEVVVRAITENVKCGRISFSA